MDEKACLICLEDPTPENPLYFTQSRKYTITNIKYSVLCKCDIRVHDKCILQWIQNKHCCPICLTKMSQTRIIRPIDIYIWVCINRIAILLFLIKLQLFVLWIGCIRQNCSLHYVE